MAFHWPILQGLTSMSMSTVN